MLPEKLFQKLQTSFTYCFLKHILLQMTVYLWGSGSENEIEGWRGKYHLPGAVSGPSNSAHFRGQQLYYLKIIVYYNYLKTPAFSRWRHVKDESECNVHHFSNLLSARITKASKSSINRHECAISLKVYRLITQVRQCACHAIA